MKSSILTSALLAFAINCSAQVSPITFETGGLDANFTWTVFENKTNPALAIINNPSSNGINGSEKVAKFTALQLGNPWAGCETKQAVDIGTFKLSSANCFVTIMVYKPVISDVGIKLVTTSKGALPEIKIPNTKINEWEKITFNFTPYINNAIYAIEDVNQLVVFPDFVARTADRDLYFDNITIGNSTLSIKDNKINNINIGPNPTSNVLINNSTLPLQNVTVIDVMGREVLSLPQVAVGETIPVQHLVEGVYFLKANIDGVSNVTRFVKSN